MGGYYLPLISFCSRAVSLHVQQAIHTWSGAGRRERPAVPQVPLHCGRVGPNSNIVFFKVLS